MTMTDDDVPDTWQRRMEEIRLAVEHLEQMCPARVDPASFLTRARIPYKVLSYRGAITWRLAELTRDAYEAFQRDHLASAVLLTRGAMETSAGLWYVFRKANEAVSTGKLGNLNDTVMRLLIGRRNNPNPDAPLAINVFNFLDHFDKEMKGVDLRGLYEVMSEVAHPNWEGTLGLFSKANAERRWTNFGRGIRNEVYTLNRNGGAMALSASLEIFYCAHSELDALLPAFIKVCERDLEERRAAGTLD